MAEGFCRHLKSNIFNVYSAGTTTHGLNPRAVKAMSTHGVDISNHTSKTSEDLKDIKFDFVFTVCSHAHENCPYHEAEKIIHTGFDDPPFLTKDMMNENEIMAVYDRVALDIKKMIENIEELL